MQWKVIGPGGGGGQFHPTVSPHDHNIVLEACDMTGGYITYDGGKSWRMFHLGMPPRAYAFDPVRANIAYAGVHGLFRSNDCGRTWNLVFPNPKHGVEQRHFGDNASIELKAPLPWPKGGGIVHRIAVDPDDPTSIYIALSANSDPSKGGALQVYHSRDDAESFSLIADFSAAEGARAMNWARCLYIDPTSPKDKRDVFLCTGQGLYKAQGTGAFERIELPASVERISCATAGRMGGKIVIAIGADDRIAVSSDGGATWEDARLPRAPKGPGQPPAHTRIMALGACENDARTLYAGVDNFMEWDATKKRYGRFYGALKSQDAGKTWRWANKCGEEGISPTFDAGWMDDYGGWWGGYPLQLGIAPHNPDICYAGDFGTSYKTENGGDTWKQVYTIPCADNAFATNGMDVTTCYGVHQDPHDADHVAISYTDIGLFDSRDGGKSWVHRLSGVPNEWVNTCYWIEYDPDVPGRAWTAWGNAHDLPRAKMFVPYFDRFSGGICRTEDGFVTQTKANRGMNEYSVCTHILLDPDSRAGARTLYVCAFAKGVYKSVDDGRRWTLQNEGLDTANLNAWHIVRDGSGRLYLIVSRGGQEGTIKNPGTLYVSDDKAESWRRIALPQSSNGPTDLAVDPRDDKHLYLACWPSSDETHEFGGGLWESFDAGDTWACAYDERAHVYDVALHPENPDVLFICGANSGAFRSDDAGRTWARLGGYRFKRGHRVFVDQYSPGMVYITTFGGSVYYGPERGDPEAVEDVVEYARPAWEAPRG